MKWRTQISLWPWSGKFPCSAQVKAVAWGCAVKNIYIVWPRSGKYNHSMPFKWKPTLENEHPIAFEREFPAIVSSCCDKIKDWTERRYYIHTAGIPEVNETRPLCCVVSSPAFWYSTANCVAQRAAVAYLPVLLPSTSRWTEWFFLLCFRLPIVTDV
jgi:hypothetical protein